MKIFCKDIQNIQWENSFPGFSKKEIHIWHVETIFDEPQLASLKKIINDDELKRAERFAFEKDRNQFITAHGALRNILSKYLEMLPAQIQFRKTNNRKPYILFPATFLKFNISHSENKILIAISDEENGIDIEMIKRGFEFKEFIRTYFSSKEQAVILSSENPEESFYKFWTRKESVLKASGIGIVDNLKEIEVCDEENFSPVFAQNFHVHSFKIEDNFFAAITTSPDKPARFFKTL